MVGAASALRHWPLLVAITAWLASPVALLASRSWTTEQGAYGPVILATGGWALAVAYRRHAAVARPGRLAIAIVALIGCATIYILARALGAVSLECLAAWGGLVATLYGLAGAAIVRRLWFPLAYLLFVIPPPYAIVGPATRALKLWLSATAADIVGALGIEVAVSGNALFVDQYELLVEAACSGLNSIVSLLAVGLFYVHLRRAGDWRYVMLMAILIVPIAIAANLVRVVLLMLLVHARGDAVLGTMLHPAAGLLMFVVALVLLSIVDAAAWRARTALARRG